MIVGIVLGHVADIAETLYMFNIVIVDTTTILSWPFNKY